MGSVFSMGSETYHRLSISAESTKPNAAQSHCLKSTDGTDSNPNADYSSDDPSTPSGGETVPTIRP